MPLQSPPANTFDLKTYLIIALATIAVFYVAVVLRGVKRLVLRSCCSNSGGLATGFVTNFSTPSVSAHSPPLQRLPAVADGSRRAYQAH
jgi:hypothetical protein